MAKLVLWTKTSPLLQFVSTTEKEKMKIKKHYYRDDSPERSTVTCFAHKTTMEEIHLAFSGKLEFENGFWNMMQIIDPKWTVCNAHMQKSKAIQRNNIRTDWKYKTYTINMVSRKYIIDL